MWIRRRGSLCGHATVRPAKLSGGIGPRPWGADRLVAAAFIRRLGEKPGPPSGSFPPHGWVGLPLGGRSGCPHPGAERPPPGRPRHRLGCTTWKWPPSRLPDQHPALEPARLRIPDRRPRSGRRAACPSRSPRGSTIAPSQALRASSRSRTGERGVAASIVTAPGRSAIRALSEMAAAALLRGRQVRSPARGGGWSRGRAARRCARARAERPSGAQVGRGARHTGSPGPGRGSSSSSPVRNITSAPAVSPARMGCRRADDGAMELVPAGVAA